MVRIDRTEKEGNFKGMQVFLFIDHMVLVLIQRETYIPVPRY